jgi:hypothetical protein
VLCALIVLAICGCDPQPNPGTAVPNLPAVISALRSGKDTTEGWGGCAKTHLKLQRRKERAQLLYTEAQAAHNQAVAYLQTGLRSKVDVNQFRQLLREADTKRNAFKEWYVEPDQAQEMGKCYAAAPSADLLLNIADLALKIIELQQNITEKQRDAIDKQLQACICVSWGRL